jgi:hypothetical protein
MRATLLAHHILLDFTTTTSPLRFHWNIGPQQVFKADVEVSVAFKFFIETGLLALCSNHQPGGPGLHIYIPWRMGDQLYPQAPGTNFSRLLRHACATVGLFFSRSPLNPYLLTYLLTCLLACLLTYLLTYLLTPLCRILFEKLIDTQLFKNILFS